MDAFIKLAAVAIIGMFPLSTNGAPVTFAFSATVDSVSGASDVVSVVPGDTITGSFTFEPAPGALRFKHPQTLGIRFDIGSLILESPTYDIAVSNDSIAIFGHSSIGPFDVINVFCSLVSTTSACSPGTVPGAEAVAWLPFVSLIDHEGAVLESRGLVGDPGVWNGFEDRTLRLTFRPAAGNSFLIFATVGSFTIVPEPTSVLLVAFGLAGLAVLRRSPWLRD